MPCIQQLSRRFDLVYFFLLKNMPFRLALLVCRINMITTDWMSAVFFYLSKSVCEVFTEIGKSNVELVWKIVV